MSKRKTEPIPSDSREAVPESSPEDVVQDFLAAVTEYMRSDSRDPYQWAEAYCKSKGFNTVTMSLLKSVLPYVGRERFLRKQEMIFTFQPGSSPHFHVNQGDTTMTDKSIQAGGDVAAVIADSIQNSFKDVTDSFKIVKQARGAEDPLTLLMDELQDEIVKLKGKIDEADAKKLAADYDMISQQAKKPSEGQDKDYLGVALKKIGDVAKKIAEIGLPVLTVVEKIRSFFHL